MRFQKTSQPDVTVDVNKLERQLKRQVDGEVRFDAASRAMYNCDASNYRQVPVGVVIPRNKQAVIDTVAVCHEFKVPILSRGCGTSLSGQCCNVAVVIDHSKYLNQILEINEKEKYAVVQPGVILDHLRSRTERDHHLTFGPDPATHNHCTLGGMIGNNSCGIHSVMSGRTADNVEELEILTFDGLQMRVGRTPAGKLQKYVTDGGRKGQIYRDLKTLIDENADLVRAKYPKIPRRVSGYNLDNLLEENGFHVARALVGTESTCVTILEAKLNLVHSPPGRALLVLGYPDIYTAADHVPQIMEHNPVGLEGIDDKLIMYMKRKKLHPEDIELMPEGAGWLLVEFGGDDKKQAQQRAREVMEQLQQCNHAPHTKLFTDEKHEEMVWEIRESGLGATANVPDMPLAWPGWEDAAVDPNRLGDYLRDFRVLLDQYNYDCALYGHFGQGCIHCRITFDLFTQPGVQKYTEFVNDAADLVNRYGGSFTGEHGDGQSKAAFLPRLYGETLLKAFEKFKHIWDPDWKMNPGKVVLPYPLAADLRLGASYNPSLSSTHFKYPADKAGMPSATLRCVGVGKCRRTENAFMCPSFLVTREEQHTTRARAHLLFEMFDGSLIKHGWKSRDVKETLDLCLACKGCKKECPVDVDLATYKAEFLSHYYKHRLRPRTAYSMGLIGYWARLLSRVPRAANFFTQTPGLEGITKWIGGIARERKMPKFALETYRHWYYRQTRTQDGPPLVLYPDAFNNYFYPETLQATYKVLTQWGFTVHIPQGPVPSIRPLIHYGMLKLAKHELVKAVRQMHSFLMEGWPIIFCEPSTAAVFRDELKSLLPSYEDGRRFRKQAFLLSEFIEQEKLPLPELKGEAIFHGHCHQKAVLNPDAMRNTLKRMGLHIEEPQKGCCGMAGSFGFEVGHYQISQQIGELALLPAVRKADDSTYIVADGFSCRTQIREGTNRSPLHLGQLLFTALEKNGGKFNVRY